MYNQYATGQHPKELRAQGQRPITSQDDGGLDQIYQHDNAGLEKRVANLGMLKRQRQSQYPQVPHIPIHIHQAAPQMPQQQVVHVPPPQMVPVQYSPNMTGIPSQQQYQPYVSQPQYIQQPVSQISQQAPAPVYPYQQPPTVDHKYLMPSKVCINCKWYQEFKRGKDKQRTVICQFYGENPWTLEFNANAVFCEWHNRDYEEPQEETVEDNENLLDPDDIEQDGEFEEEYENQNESIIPNN
jgi:hypothetical protein